MKRVKTVAAGLIMLVLFSGFAIADVLLIGNNSITEKSLAKKDIQRIFLGKMKRWSNGDRIYPVTLRRGPVRKDFLENYVNNTASAFLSYWRREIVAGTGIPPKSFGTEAEVVEYVSTKKGSIGYISTSTAHEGVKIISIDK